jgi:putative membrane protein
MLKPSIAKNDSMANWLIGIFSLVVFLIVVVLSKFKLDVELGFDVHIFATINAFVNATIAVVLVAALIAVKKEKL